MLGIALSKYSLALPVVLLFLWERRARALAVAAGVQIAGLLLVSSLAEGSLDKTLQIYLRIMLRHTDLPGIHLATFFGENRALAYVATGVITLAVCTFLLRWWRRDREIVDAAVLPLLTVLAMWTLLVAYHRSYDAILFILFVATAITALAGQIVNRAQFLLLSGILVVTLVPTNLPSGLALGGLIPAELIELWDLAIERSITVAAILMLACALWLLSCLTDNLNPARAQPESC